MSDNTKIEFKLNTNPSSKENSERTTAPLIGKITEHIGRGDDAKHSIIWSTIKYSFVSAGTISILLAIGLLIVYANEANEQIEPLQRFIMSVWTVFTPIITLALGYAFGKDKS